MSCLRGSTVGSLACWGRSDMGGSREVLSGRARTIHLEKKSQSVLTSLFLHVDEKVWDLSGFPKPGECHFIEIPVSWVK